jgi:predicted acyltransferase
VAGGWSLLLLSLFYVLIDVIGWRSWAFFWIVIGANAIAIFVVPRFVDFQKMAAFFLTGVAEFVGDGKNLVLVTGALAAKWLFLWFLYRQRIFLRL